MYSQQCAAEGEQTKCSGDAFSSKKGYVTGSVTDGTGAVQSLKQRRIANSISYHFLSL